MTVSHITVLYSTLLVLLSACQPSESAAALLLNPLYCSVMLPLRLIPRGTPAAAAAAGSQCPVPARRTQSAVR